MRTAQRRDTCDQKSQHMQTGRIFFCILPLTLHLRWKKRGFLPVRKNSLRNISDKALGSGSKTVRQISTGNMSVISVILRPGIKIQQGLKSIVMFFAD